MKIVSKNKNNVKPTKRKKVVNHLKEKRKHPQYGTSKLEERFASEFLDRLGVKYEYQFEAKDIGRFYDFYLPEHRLLIELDGDYWHGNPELYEEKDLKGHQRRAKRVDEYKDKWALLHGIPLMRIWEHEINENPEKVLKELSERLNIQIDKINKKKKKGERHINIIK